MTQTLLHIDASARLEGSTSRMLSQQVVDHLNPAEVIRRDLTDPLPQITEAWVGANFTPEDKRSDAQRAALELSDTLVEELRRANTIVIGTPVYNFGIPAALKAWVDLITRAGLTFQYTENGPNGLLADRRAVIVMASGGTAAGSEYDFCTGYLRHILGFVGITDVQLIAADKMAVDAKAALSTAQDQIRQLDV